MISEFRAMLESFNAQQLNDLTISISGLTYKAPKILSGAFIKLVIKTAGPIVALGFMVCMVLIVISRKKEEKKSGAGVSENSPPCS